MQRMDVEFPVEGDVALRGWLLVPDGTGPHPAITMAHGFAGVKEHGLDRFARLFADAGFVAERRRLEPALPAWVPLPVTEFALGRATRPAA